jgi:hypothetical protein
MSGKKDSNIVDDGAARIAEHLRKEIEQQVRAKYAQRLATAGPLRRLWLRVKMYFEVERRLRRELKEKAPKDALYFGPQKSADCPGRR